MIVAVGLWMAAPRVNLDEEVIGSFKICMIGAGGFIGSHLCEKLLSDTDHSVLAIDVHGEKITHLLQPGRPWSHRIEFHKINIKSDSRLQGLIKVSDLVCTFIFLLVVISVTHTLLL